MSGVVHIDYNGQGYRLGSEREDQTEVSNRKVAILRSGILMSTLATLVISGSPPLAICAGGGVLLMHFVEEKVNILVKQYFSQNRTFHGEYKINWYQHLAKRFFIVSTSISFMSLVMASVTGNLHNIGFNITLAILTNFLATCILQIVNDTFFTDKNVDSLMSYGVLFI